MKAEKEILKFLRPEKGRVEFLSTDCTTLNLACSQRGNSGGIPRGRITNFVGDGSSGKTLLAIEICANALFNLKEKETFLYPKVKKVEIVYNNIEGVMDFPLELMYGSKFRDSVQWIQTPTCEEFGRDFMSRLQKHKEGTALIYVVDSLDALVPKAALQRTLASLKSNTDEKDSMGMEKANFFSRKFFDRLCSMMMGKDVSLICISQVRDNIGVTFGEKSRRTGGRALNFYSHLVVWLAEIEKLRKTYDGRSNVYGVKIRARVKRNKVAKAFREADYTVINDYGMSNIDSCVDYLYGNDAKKIEWDNGKENIIFPREEFVQYVQSKPKAMQRLTSMVESLWEKIEKKTSVVRKRRFE